jgi:hypothetical protein
LSKRQGQSLLDLVADPQSARLLQAFSKIAERDVKRSLVELVENVASAKRA